MSFLNENTRARLTDYLKDLREDVQVVLFTQEYECDACRETHQFLTELCELSDQIFLTVYDFVNNKAMAQSLQIAQIPAIALLDHHQQDTRIRFYGPPGGYEINSFLHSLKAVAGMPEVIPLHTAERIKKINRSVHIQVFVTPLCPYCPAAVINAHRLALENPNIRADMVDASVFPHLANKYRVTGVPKMIINETHELMGSQPLKAILDIIEKL